MIPRRKGQIHFTFRSHTHGDGYRSGKFRRNMKAHIMEWSEGHAQTGPLTLPDIALSPQEREEAYRHELSREKTLAPAAERKLVYAGESGTPQEIARLERLRAEEKQALKLMDFSNLSQLRNYFDIVAERTRLREKLIVETVKRLRNEGKVPIDARYGVSHSTISRQLQIEGIPSTRNTVGTVFSHHLQIPRILISETKKPIPDILYKKAGVSLKFYNFLLFNKIAKKPIWQHRDADTVFVETVLRSLVDNLSEPQLDRALTEEKNYRCLFTLNGLPKDPSKKQLVDFLNKHSAFWRRQQAIARMKRETAAEQKAKASAR